MVGRVLSQRLSLGVSGSTSSLSGVDAARLRRLVDAHFDSLWRFLRRLGLSEADTDDAVQEVILVLARKLERVDAKSERSFIFSTAFRVASDMRKRAKRRRETDDEMLRELPTESPDPEVSADSQRLAVLFDRVLSRLSLELRAVFVLYELEDFTMAEIASSLELPPGTVASRLRRGREAFERLAAQALAEGELP